MIFISGAALESAFPNISFNLPSDWSLRQVGLTSHEEEEEEEERQDEGELISEQSESEDQHTSAGGTGATLT